MGTVLGSLVLGAALVGLIAYAALNQGSGVRDLIRTETPPSPASSSPRTSSRRGTWTGRWTTSRRRRPEHALHSLEHGAVWTACTEYVPEDQVEQLASKVDGNPYVLLSPLPEQTSLINLSAGGRRLPVDSADDPRIDDFIEGHASGPTTPGRGAACAGNTSTGPVQGAPAPVAPATPAPSPTS